VHSCSASADLIGTYSLHRTQTPTLEQRKCTRLSRSPARACNMCMRTCTSHARARASRCSITVAKLGGVALATLAFTCTAFLVVRSFFSASFRTLSPSNDAIHVRLPSLARFQDAQPTWQVSEDRIKKAIAQVFFMCVVMISCSCVSDGKCFLSEHKTSRTSVILVRSLSCARSPRNACIGIHTQTHGVCVFVCVGGACVCVFVCVWVCVCVWVGVHLCLCVCLCFCVYDCLY